MVETTAEEVQCEDGIYVERFESSRRFVTVESWMLRDVADGRVPHYGLALYCMAQSFGRAERLAFPGNARLAGLMRTSTRHVQRGLAVLASHGWVVRRTVTRRGMPGRVFYFPVRGGDAGCRGGGDVQRRGGGDPSRHPEVDGEEADEEEKNPPTPQRGVDASGSNDEKPGRVDGPSVDAFVDEAVKRWPKGLTSGGEVRYSSRAACGKRMRAALRGLKAPEADAAMARCLALVREKAQGFQCVAADDERRQYVPALEVWLGKRPWEREGGPTFVHVRSDAEKRTPGVEATRAYLDRDKVAPPSLESLGPSVLAAKIARLAKGLRGDSDGEA